MHEWGDSGITAVFFALIVAVLISVGVAQQARARAARCQEIRRLQFEAALEAQREEAEAAAEYKSMVGTRNAVCAICCSISNTRCSRCKSVRYCSATCQSLHWKQGHKQECRAPDPPSSGSSIASSRIFSDDFSRSSSTSESRTLSEISEFQETQDTNHFEFLRTTSSNGATANGALSKPKKVLFPYKSFVRFFNYDRLGVPPCGLINCGNSCFANVVLQCLTYTRPLTAYLLADLHGNKCTRNDWCFMCELQDHVFRVRKEQNAFSPIRILSRIREIGNHLGYGRQEDAHEFMRFAIDSMQSTCLDEFGGEKSVDSRSQETTLIHHIFGGHLQSQVQCMQCLHESNRYEKMMDLAVEIHGSVETLEDALAQFTAPEWLDGDNKYKCDRCNAYVKGKKRLTLHEAPNILTVALKRFQSGKFGKLNKRVTFPEVLDMMPYMSGNGDRPPAYLLYAVVVHVDMLNASFFGHYICYVKDSQGIWYKLDDSKVKEVDIEKVMSQKAYMLFYTRSSARPAPEMDDDVAAVNLPATVRPNYEDLGVVKVYQEASLHVPGMMPAVGGTMGLHAMVEPEQREGYFEGGPQTVKAHAFVNGEHVTTQSSSWERDIVCESNDDEISDSGFVASSSSHSVISPTSSSHLSTEEPGVVRKVLVCNPLGSSIEEDTEVPSRDHVSPMSSDLADIALHVNSLDKPLTPKIGKRRLDEGLTPLPAPKPLDTDQLPAWPTSSNGRSSPSPPVCLSAAIQINGILPNAPNPSRQKYLGDRTGESPAPPASPEQHRISSDQACFAASAEPGFDSERIYLEMMNFSESAGASDEDLIGRAKRQHVEVDRSDLSPMERVARLGGMVQAPEQPDVSELDSRDMEWNEVPQTGYPASVAVSGPVFDSCADILPPDTNYCAPAGEVQTFPSSLRQVLLDEQVKDGSPQPFHTDETLAEIPGGYPLSLERAVEGTEVSLESDLWRTMQLSPPSNIMVYEAPGGSALLDNCVPSKAMRCKGVGGREPMERSESENLSCEDREALTILPLLNGHPADLLLQAFENAPQVETCELRPLPVSPHVQCTTEDGVWTSSWKEDASPVDKQGPEVVTAETAAPVKVQRQKSTLKPLFARGFLNRVNNPVLNCTSTRGSTGTGGRTSSDETYRETEGKPEGEEKGISERCNGAENGRAILNNPEEEVPIGNGCQGATSSAFVDIGNGCLPTASSNGAGSSSASYGNEAFKEAVNPYRNGGLRNGMETDDRQGHGEVKLRNKAGTSSRGKRSAAAQVGNGTFTSATEGQATHSGQAARSSFARPSSGKQKQGRNESCHCGSQRKWKKCCGKSEGMAPEISERIS